MILEQTCRAQTMGSCPTSIPFRSSWYREFGFPAILAYSTQCRAVPVTGSVTNWSSVNKSSILYFSSCFLAMNALQSYILAETLCCFNFIMCCISAFCQNCLFCHNFYFSRRHLQSFWEFRLLTDFFRSWSLLVQKVRLLLNYSFLFHVLHQTLVLTIAIATLQDSLSHRSSSLST